jgi:hypothetical protein
MNYILSENKTNSEKSYLHPSPAQFKSAKQGTFHFILPNIFNRENKTRISNLSLTTYNLHLGIVPEKNIYYAFSDNFFNSHYFQKANLRAPPAIS